MTIAEESTAFAGVSQPTNFGGLGFGFKWNMGWMHDTLEYMSRDPIYRRWSHDKMTFGLLYAFAENFILPISHDEVVHGKGSVVGKMPGDEWQRFANARAYYGFMWGHPGKKLLFMGQEFGQTSEWNCDEALPWWLLEHWPHQGLQALMRDLNRLYRETPALYARDCEGGRLPLDRRRRRRAVGAGVPAHGRRRRPAGRGRLQLHPRGARRLPHRPAASPGAGARRSTPTPSSTAAPTSAIWARSSPKSSRCTDYAASAALTLPPLATVFLDLPGAVERKLRRKREKGGNRRRKR